MLHLKLLSVLAGAGVVAGGAAAPAIASDAGSRVPLCRSSQLVITLARTEGAAGSHYETWRMTDVGGTCRTQGWIGALNFGRDGRPLATTVRRVNGPAPGVTLLRGQHASFVLRYTNPGILACRPEDAVAMIVTPPDNTAPALVRPGERACRGVVDAWPVRFGG
jgi:Protein of unknown function (DUF4232)